MCFLKNLSHKQSRPLSSAFKKVEKEHSEPTPQTSEDELKGQDLRTSKTGENSEVISTSSEVSEIQKVQLHFIMEMLQANTSVAWSLVERNTAMEKTIATLTSELEELKKRLGNPSSKKTLPSIALDADDVASKLTLKLFGKRDYKYQMVLAEPISHQLYKQRNFDLKINIVDAQQNLILNSNPIPISLCVYTSEEEPTIIHTNKTGQPILKGNSQSQLFHGNAQFRKIHLREVSSYYANGWVHLVVYPKAPSFNYNAKESTLEETVDYELIKPLVISEVVIRAKKK